MVLCCNVREPKSARVMKHFWRLGEENFAPHTVSDTVQNLSFETTLSPQDDSAIVNILANSAPSLLRNASKHFPVEYNEHLTIDRKLSMAI